MNNKSIGGILIIPLNFWCSIRKQDVNLRKDFLNIYNILLLNIFEEKVFSDTSYSICSFQFELKSEHTQPYISTIIYPMENKIKLYLNEENNYTIGGNIYYLPQNKNIKITRLTKHNFDSKYITNIFLKCIDDSLTNKINLSIVPNDKIYVDDTEKSSARSYASIIIEPKLSLEKQKILVNKFNEFHLMILVVMNFYQKLSPQI